MNLDEIRKCTAPMPPLAKPIRGWSITADGSMGAEVEIPAGARLLCGSPKSMLRLHALYGSDHTVGTFLLPGAGEVVDLFHEVLAAAAALPDDLSQWDVPTQRYVNHPYGL